MSDNENKFDDCFCKLHEKIKNIEIKTDDDVIDILKQVFIVIGVSDLEDETQKELAMKLVKKVVEDSSVNDLDKFFLLDLIDNGIIDISGNCIYWYP